MNNDQQNCIHERALRLVYSDHVSSFNELLKKTDQFLFTTGTFKVELLNSSFIMVFSKYHKNVFYLNTNIPYNLRSRIELHCRNSKTVKYGTETISYFPPTIWSSVPNAIKSRKSLDVFKAKIRQWVPDCPYVRITYNISVSSSFSLITFSEALQT